MPSEKGLTNPLTKHYSLPKLVSSCARAVVAPLREPFHAAVNRARIAVNKHHLAVTTVLGLGAMGSTFPLSLAYIQAKEAKSPENVLTVFSDEAGYRHGVMVFVLNMPLPLPDLGSDLQPLFDPMSDTGPTVISYNPYYDPDGELLRIDALPENITVYDNRAEFNRALNLIQEANGRLDKQFNRSGIWYSGRDGIFEGGPEYAGRLDPYRDMSDHPNQPPLTRSARAVTLGIAYLEAAIEYLQYNPDQVQHLTMVYWAPETGNPFYRESSWHSWFQLDTDTATITLSGELALPYLGEQLKNLRETGVHVTHANIQELKTSAEWTDDPEPQG